MLTAGTVVESYSHYQNLPSPFPTQARWPAKSPPPYRLSRIPAENLSWHKPKSHVISPSSTAAMASLNPEEMEAFQRLSDQYRPDIQGPLVGTKMAISALLTEYAQADPRFGAKIVSLAATHSAYRPIKGDGQCGWRAAVFGYFETLLHLGELHIVLQEIARIRSFDETLQMAGIQVDLLVDMFDSTYLLFQKVRQAVERGDKDESIILATLNDEGESNFVLYHFKTMTSAYMELHAEQYQPFLEVSVQEYRATRIDPSNQEIDQIGLQALTDGVIGPAGIALDVSYLDRSIGDEVTPHRFVPNADEGWPVIRLLYRPGHYDMLYKSSRPIQVLLQDQQMTYNTFSSAPHLSQDMDIHSFLFPNESVWQRASQPGMYDTASNHRASPSEQQVYTDTYEPQYKQTYIPTPTAGQTVHPPLIRQNWPEAVVTDVEVSPPSPVPPTTSTTSAKPTQQRNKVLIRPSKESWEFQRNKHESIPLQTGPLRRLPFNQAHFLNIDFQPLEWNADEEYHDGKATTRAEK